MRRVGKTHSFPASFTVSVPNDGKYEIIENYKITNDSTYRDQNIQVNTLSTILLALLLLPWMKAERANRSAPAHLAVTGSGRHLDPNIQEWQKWASETGLLEHFSKPENWPGASNMYAATKLMAQFSVNELVKMALGPDGR